MRKGYLTVFLSLSITLILSIILLTIEGARLRVVDLRTECVNDIGMNSVLGEFHRELLEQYDLLFVDMSYGSGAGKIANSEEHLRRYMQKNVEPTKSILSGFYKDFLNMHVDRASIREYSLASDYSGSVMRSQALSYMENYTLEGKLAQILEHISILEGLGMDTRDLDAERESNQQVIESIELPMEEDEDGNEHEVPLNNPADIVNSLRSSGVLNLVLDKSEISTTQVEVDRLASHRKLQQGIYGENLKKPEVKADKLIFDEYLIKKCGYFGNVLGKSQLSYELEYILYGNDLDWENLEKVAKRIARWREVSNFIYLCADSEKQEQAKIMATALTAVALVPELEEPVTLAILFAWAYLESLVDVKILLHEGKIPIIKDDSTWKTPLLSILTPRAMLASVNGGGGSGLSYIDYLRIMLYLEDKEDVNMRFMDIAELDIRKTEGNSQFRIDNCFDHFYAENKFSYGFGGSKLMKRVIGYDLEFPE